jgi:hypothetical protein
LLVITGIAMDLFVCNQLWEINFQVIMHDVDVIDCSAWRQIGMTIDRALAASFVRTVSRISLMMDDSQLSFVFKTLGVLKLKHFGKAVGMKPYLHM